MKLELMGDQTLILPSGEKITDKSPVYGGARELIKRGYDPTTEVSYWRGDTLCFGPAMLAQFAQWQVSDPNKGRITRGKWHPHPLSKDGGDLLEKIEAALPED